MEYKLRKNENTTDIKLTFLKLLPWIFLLILLLATSSLGISAAAPGGNQGGLL